jgi:fumarate reductase flavoprotein subunit
MAEHQPSIDVDVVIAGAGAAGTSAALAAAQGGASVVLLEAQETYRQGSNTAMSTSMIPAGGSRWQEALGIDDSPERFAADIRAKTKGTADPVTTEALTTVAPELVAWLADHGGLPLDLVTDFRYPGHSRDRCHAVPDRAGRTMHGHLLDRVAEHEAITLVVPMRLVDVEVEAGRVRAVVVAAPDGTRETIRTAAVVLATNGFGADAALVRDHLPDIAAGTYHGGDGSRGDALRIGQRLGADIGYLDAYQGHGSLASPHGVLLTWATVMHGAVLLNRDGDRFGDETEGYSEFGARVVAQPDASAWMVFDERIDAACRGFADYQDLLEAGAVRWADGTEELARVVGAPVERLEATLARAEAAARGDRQDDHGRRDFEAPLSAPYAAVKVTGALFHTQGGLHVDANAQVLAGDRALGGLYAAGGAAVGISGHGSDGYLAGNGLLSALGLGYLAGRHLTRAANAG